MISVVLVAQRVDAHLRRQNILIKWRELKCFDLRPAQTTESRDNLDAQRFPVRTGQSHEAQ